MPNGTRRLVAAAAGLLAVSACQNSSSPSSQSLTDFVTGVTATNAAVTSASQSRGAAPSVSGGPAVTVTSSGTSSSATVASGGSSFTHLRASSAFQTVYVSVIDDPLDGFYTLTLPSATTDTFVIVQLGSSIPINTFQTVFSVATASGAVGAPSSIANTVSTAALNLTGTWAGVTPDGVTFTPGADAGCDGDLRLNLTQVGAALTGTISATTRALNNSDCKIGETGTSTITNGTAGGTGLSFRITGDHGDFVATFSGAVSGNRMSGVVIGSGDGAQVGTFAATRQ